MSRRPPLALLALLTCTACQDWGAFNRVPQDKAYDPSPLFADGKVMRTPPAGTVPRESLEVARQLREARTAWGAWREEVPLPATPALYARGRAGFETYCGACHGLLGNGESVVAENLPMRRPPDLFGPEEWAHGRQERLLEAEDAGEAGARRGEAAGAGLPPAPRPKRPERLTPHPAGYYFAVITEGYGLMRAYAAELPVEERWAVVAYLRALALAQRAPLAAAPPQVQQQLLQGAP